MFHFPWFKIRAFVLIVGFLLFFMLMGMCRSIFAEDYYPDAGFIDIDSNFVTSIPPGAVRLFDEDSKVFVHGYSDNRNADDNYSSSLRSVPASSVFPDLSRFRQRVLKSNASYPYYSSSYDYYLYLSRYDYANNAALDDKTLFCFWFFGGELRYFYHYYYIRLNGDNTAVIPNYSDPAFLVADTMFSKVRVLKNWNDHFVRSRTFDSYYFSKNGVGYYAQYYVSVSMLNEDGPRFVSDQSLPYWDFTPSRYYGGYTFVDYVGSPRIRIDYRSPRMWVVLPADVPPPAAGLHCRDFREGFYCYERYPGSDVAPVSRDDAVFDSVSAIKPFYFNLPAAWRYIDSFPFFTEREGVFVTGGDDFVSSPPKGFASVGGDLNQPFVSLYPNSSPSWEYPPWSPAKPMVAYPVVRYHFIPGPLAFDSPVADDGIFEHPDFEGHFPSSTCHDMDYDSYSFVRLVDCWFDNLRSTSLFSSVKFSPGSNVSMDSVFSLAPTPSLGAESGTYLDFSAFDFSILAGMFLMASMGLAVYIVLRPKKSTGDR